MKIISGGQTGVDRAALDVALKHGIEAGGWVPAGRLAEDGCIPEHYPVTEMPEGGGPERTRRNVEESDGTVIFYSGEPRGGSKQTRVCCLELKRPCQLIDAERTTPAAAAEKLASFVRENGIAILNIAGPRKSEWPEGYVYAFAVLSISLPRLVD